MEIEIRVASLSDATSIAEMTVALTEEISSPLGQRSFGLDLKSTAKLCEELLTEGRYFALVAMVENKPVGFVGLSEGRALYAGGSTVTMQEFYVMPAERARGVGGALIEAVVQRARSRGCKRIEVCTPPLPAFDRSLAFYEANGFEITGGRKLKRHL